MGVSLLAKASGVRLGGAVADPSVDGDSKFMIVSTITISPPRAELRGQKFSLSINFVKNEEQVTCECACLEGFETAIP